MLLKIVGSNIPNGTHMKAKSIETPARVKATGYPISSAEHINIRRRKGISSICFYLNDEQKLSTRLLEKI